MTDLEVRDLLARTAIERAFIRKHRDLNDRALAHLVEAAAETAAFKYHMATGTALPVAEILSGAERSEVGLLIFGRLSGNEPGSSADPDTGFLAERMTKFRSEDR